VCAFDRTDGCVKSPMTMTQHRHVRRIRLEHVHRRKVTEPAEVLAVSGWRRSVGSTGRRRRPFMAVVQCHPTWRWAAGSSALIGDVGTQRTLDRPDHHCTAS
jgi:hypothetical protein